MSSVTLETTETTKKPVASVQNWGKVIDDVIALGTAVNDNNTNIGNLEITEDTPVNAVAGSYKITALEFATLDNDDTVTVDGNVFTKVASATEADEFDDLAGLVALVDALDNYDGTSTDGDTTCTITYSTKGVIGNSKDVVINSVAATTGSFNSGVTASTVKILEADLTELDAGDTVEFDGNTFTKVASEAGADEFTNTAGLIALLDALTDWGASADGNNIDVTYTDNTTDKDGIDVNMTYNRATANGVDGTVTDKVRQFVYSDASYVYYAIDANTIADDNWRRISLGSAY